MHAAVFHNRLTVHPLLPTINDNIRTAQHTHSTGEEGRRRRQERKNQAQQPLLLAARHGTIPSTAQCNQSRLINRDRRRAKDRPPLVSFFLLPSSFFFLPSSSGAHRGVMRRSRWYDDARSTLPAVAHSEHPLPPAAGPSCPAASAVRRNQSCLGQTAGVGGYQLQLRGVQAFQVRQQRRTQLQVCVHHAHHRSLHAAHSRGWNEQLMSSFPFFFF